MNDKGGLDTTTISGRPLGASSAAFSSEYGGYSWTIPTLSRYFYSSEASFKLIHPKKKVCMRARVHACTRVRLLLVLVCGIMYLVCCVIPSYIVSAHLVSYCLLVRQQRFHHPTLRTSTDFYCLLVLLVRQKQRFHHPTLRTTSVTLVVCFEKIKGCRV